MPPDQRRPRPSDPQRRRQLITALAGTALLPLGGLAGNARAASTGELPLSVLLIGNADYRNGAELLNPLRDLELLSRTFENRGAQVTTATNLSAEQIGNAIGGFLTNAARNANAIWLGYSGHAVQIDGRNWLQGVESDFSSPRRVREAGIDLDRICAQLMRSNPAAGVVSIDACRNNPFEPERTRGTVAGLAAQQTHGLCVSFSTAPYTKALDGESGQNSPYARALADALAGKERKLLDDVLRETANQVYASTRQRQIPEYRSALRRQWWFGAKGIELTGTDTQPAAPSGASRGKTREAAYRPDEPSSDTPYDAMTDTEWKRYEAGHLAQLKHILPVEAQDLVQRAQFGGTNDEESIRAALLLEEAVFGVSKDPSLARRLLTELSQHGNALAQTMLGESLFDSGQFDQAYKWLSLAARTGYERAMGTELEQLADGGLQGHLGGLLGSVNGLRDTSSNLSAPRTPPRTPPTESIYEFKRMASPNAERRR